MRRIILSCYPGILQYDNAESAYLDKGVSIPAAVPTLLFPGTL